ncbi:FAD-dependent oxidoreductase [uncultured Psychrobacter sp.]|nr:FAD-dependent oxidoreductase [uncultured Psychrobacter sp.]
MFVSSNLDMTPEIGYLNSKKIIYSCGCIGHGVSLTHLNGKLIAQLLSEQDSDLTDF